MATPAPELIPLATGDDGVIRVDGTRVTLDTVVTAFNTGATAEEIVQDYDVLDLADVYAVIAYYLRHRGEVGEYLERQTVLRKSLRLENEARSNQQDLRQRLLARLPAGQRGRYECDPKPAGRGYTRRDFGTDPAAAGASVIGRLVRRMPS